LAFVSQEVLEEIRAGNDLVDVVSSYVPLKRSGNSYKGLCPFHNEKSPSFHVRADEQYYKCFGCGAGGNVFGFIMQIENMPFPDAVKMLAERIRYTIPDEAHSPDSIRRYQQRERLFEIHKVAARFYYDALAEPTGTNQGGAAARYLDARGVSAAMRKKFGLGWSPGGFDTLYKHLINNRYSHDDIITSGLALDADKTVGARNTRPRDRFYNRLMYPIFDARSNIVGFGGRTIGDEHPKYLNSPDTPIFDKSRNLYGINFARQSKSSELIMVEGYMDVIALVQAGFANVCAALGTAFNNNHAREIKKYCSSVVLLFDSDEAGEKAVLRALPFLSSNGISTKVLRLEGAKDPDDFIKAHGAAVFQTAIQAAESAVAFRLNHEKAKHKPDNTEKKIAFVNAAANIIGELSNAVEREIYIESAAISAGVSVAAIKEEVSKRIDTSLEQQQPRPLRSRPTIIAGKTAPKGLDDAQRGLLRVMALRGDLRAKIASHITTNELQNEAYIKLYNIFCGEHLNNGSYVFSATVMNNFETPEEQNIVSNIFAHSLIAENDVTLIKNVNDWLGAIKEAYVDLLLSNETDVTNLKNLAEIRRNARKQYIT